MNGPSEVDIERLKAEVARVRGDESEDAAARVAAMKSEVVALTARVFDIKGAQKRAPNPKPWPHGWRPWMRVLPVHEDDELAEPDSLPAVMVYRVLDARTTRLPSGEPCLALPPEVLCVNEDGSYAGRFRQDDPRIRPDLDDNGTVGHLKGMVREKACDPFVVAQNMQGYDAITDWVVFLEGMDHHDGPHGETEGKAYVAALDHLAAMAGE